MGEGESSAAVKRLRDRAAIEDTILRYANALDRLVLEPDDATELASCFSHDVVAEYGKQVLHGSDELIGMLRGAAVYERTTHHTGNISMEFTGPDRAIARSSCIAYICGADPETDELIIRGVRYRDELREIDERWVITARRHSVDWMVRVPSVTLDPLSMLASR